MAKVEKTRLITKKEQKYCKQVAAQDKGLASQRAKVLLAINDGASRAMASETSGLTPGQIQYLLKVFKIKRLAIFPESESVKEKTSKNKKVKSKKMSGKSKMKKSKKDKKKDKSKKSKSNKEKKSKNNKKKQKDKKKKSKKGKNKKK